MDRHGLTLLHHVAGQWEASPLMEWLLESGEMDVNAQDMMGYTPLRRAASIAGHEHFRLLFEHGANASIPDHWRRLPVQILLRDETVRNRTDKAAAVFAENARSSGAAPEAGAEAGLGMG